MATIKKLPSGKWQSQIARSGIRKSKAFTTKQEAKDWSSRQEYLILNAPEESSEQTLGDVCLRYARDVSPKRKGAKWEIVRLQKLAREKDLAAITMRDLAPSALAKWLDRRLQEVKPASVAREMNLLSSMLTVARREWGLIDRNPIQDVQKPKKPQPRNRIATEEELIALGTSAGADLSKVTARVFHAFLFACQTAMRAGEIIGLSWERIDLEKRFLHIPDTKNGYPRDVPLSQEARRLLEMLPTGMPSVFGINSKQQDVLWCKVRARAGIEGLTFHDSRRMGTTLLARKLDLLELAKVTGHRDAIMLLNTYYKADVADIALKLDRSLLCCPDIDDTLHCATVAPEGFLSSPGPRAGVFRGDRGGSSDCQSA